MVPFRATVLDLVSGRGTFTRDLCGLGHRVFAVAPDDATLDVVARRHAPEDPDAPRLLARARGIALPFRRGWFDAVTLAQPAPEWEQSLPEAVRVLRPGGHVATLHIVRDDTIPWVRRMARILQEVDPQAMAGATTTATDDVMAATGLFERTEEQTFRHWVDVDRQGLAAMVLQRPRVRELPEAERRDLLDRVGDLVADISRGRQVSLPYRIVCHRGWPDPEYQGGEPSVTMGIHLRWWRESADIFGPGAAPDRRRH